MRGWWVVAAMATMLVPALESRASGAIPLGAAAPNFTKNLLGGGSTSLSDYSGKVVVLYLFGYS